MYPACPEEPKEPTIVCAPPECMVCCRIERKGAQAGRKPRPKRKTRAKSRELRAGILYMGCECEKRNGLQDQCMRSECQGSPECLTKPDPICGPSEFAGGKHLGRNADSFYEEGMVDAEGRIGAEYYCMPAVLVATENVAKIDIPLPLPIKDK